MKQAQHYSGLDLLRFGAAWLVVLYHLSVVGVTFSGAQVPQDQAAFPGLHPFVDVGSVGVEIFFLISGFVICASAVGKTATGFALRRAIRVFPALWISGLLALVVQVLSGAPIFATVAAYVRYAILSPVGPYIDGSVWTLVVEAVFYALVFAALLFRQTARLPDLAKLLGLVSAMFLLALFTAKAFAAGNGTAAVAASLLERFPFRLLLLRHGVFFAVGILLWSGFDRGFARRDFAWIAWFAAFASLEICFDRIDAAAVVNSLILWWGSFGILVFSIRRGSAIRRILGRFEPWAQVCGLLSYLVYLNHYTLCMVLVPGLISAGMPRGAVLLSAILTVSAVSYLIMRFPERSIQGVLRNALRAWEAGRTASSRARQAVLDTPGR